MKIMWNPRDKVQYPGIIMFSFRDLDQLSYKNE